MVELSMRKDEKSRWKIVKCDESELVDEIKKFADEHDINEVKVRIRATAVLKTQVKGLGALFG